MIVKVIFLLILAVIIMFAVVVAGADTPVGSPWSRVQTRPRMSSTEVKVVFVLALVAMGFVVYLAAATEGFWWLVPVIVWAIVWGSVRQRSRERERRRLVAEQLEIKRQAEERARAKREKALRQRERLDQFGKDGVKLLDKADAAVEEILATEAARTGWLGGPTEVNFRADLATIAETLDRSSPLLDWSDPARAL
jgi:hypothetical protein